MTDDAEVPDDGTTDTGIPDALTPPPLPGADPVRQGPVAVPGDPDSVEGAEQEAIASAKVPWLRVVVSFLLAAVIIAAMTWFIRNNAAEYEQGWREISAISDFWKGALVVAGLVNIVVYPFTVLVAVPQLSYWQGFVERQAGFLVSNTIPGGGAVAVGTQYAILNRYRVPGPLSMAAVSADAVWTYLLTLGMPALGVGLLVLEGRRNGQLTALATIGGAGFLVSLIIIFLVLRSQQSARRLGEIGQRVADWFFKVFKRTAPNVIGGAVHFHDTAHDLVSQKWLPLTISNVAAQVTPFLVLLCALAGVGILPDEISLIEAFAAYSAAILLTSFPLTPGGLGTVDAALIALLVTFGASGAEAAAADVLWRLVWFLPQLVVGALAFLGYLIAKRRHPEVTTSAA